MKEILRLLGKTVLYFEVHERTLLPDIFNELVFVRARTFPHFLKRKWDFENEAESFERAGDKTEILDGGRDAFDQEEAPFSLSMITKKMLSSVKIVYLLYEVGWSIHFGKLSLQQLAPLYFNIS